MNAPAISFPFQPDSGLIPGRKPIRRMLSKMEGMFRDEVAFKTRLARGDRVVYEFYDMGLPEKPGDIAFGTSITHPGKVGDEYFMTKGHFHEILETAEVYYCLRGRGALLMENPEGDVLLRDLTPGTAVYVPGRYAHRSINTSPDEPLITFFAFRADAGHDYGTIETRGFRKCLVEREGTPTLIDNPSWEK